MATRPVKVWDLPVRLTHWSFAVIVPAMYFTAENSLWGWHLRLGHVLLGLLIFRLIWGVVGSRTARFSSFVRGPRTVLDYLRGRGGTGDAVGHNPLGALAVIALLSVMLTQAGMGLFAGDPYDGATGPLNPLIGVATADMLTDWHKTFFYVVLGMVALHLSAIALYAGIKFDNLIGPMITGKRDVAPNVEGIAAVPVGTAITALAVSAGIVVWVWFGAPPLA
jgi:cytochrome b